MQSKKFDKEGTYIKQWMPELANIEAKKLHDETYLLNTEIEGYPKPMLKHKEASKEALAYYKQQL